MDDTFSSAGPAGEGSVAVPLPVDRPSSSYPLRFLGRALVIGLFGLALAHNLHLTWQRWGDPIVDSGRELDTPKQILEGKTLYKDVRYWYGPLAPYTNAALYKLFGVRIGTLTWAGIASAAILAWLVYRTVRLFAGRPAAAVTAIAFLYVNGFGQFYQGNIFNFALPYTYSATYGMLLATASVYFLLRHAKRGRTSDFLLSCLCLALTATCKLEVLFAAGAAHAVFIVGWLVARRMNRLVYLIGYSGAIAIPVCVYAYFLARTGRALWGDNLFLPGNVTAKWYTLEHAGLADSLQSLKEFGFSAAGMAGCALALWAGAFGERRVRRDPTYDRSMRAMAIGAISLASALVCGTICYLLGVFETFRALPALLAFGFLAFAVRWLTRSMERAAQVPWMVLCAFGLAGAARMILRCGAEHYGFYLLVPGLMGFAVLWCRIVPEMLGASPAGADIASATPTPAPPTVSVYLCGLAMLAAVAWSHGVETQRNTEATYGRDDLTRISTARGSMIFATRYKGTVDEAVRFLEHKPPTTKVVVMPEGSGIAFLAGCTNPLGVHGFLPINFSAKDDESEMVKRLAAADPDYIVRVPRDVREYGKKAFGDDYGKPVLDWVQAHYKIVKQFRTKTYLVAVYDRK